MSGSDKRSARRYVIDDLRVEIDGVVHEVVDVSTRAVAVVGRAGLDYSMVKQPCRFLSASTSELARPISEMKFVTQRGVTVVLDYVILEYRLDVKAWEDVLRRNDVRADVVPLEDVFG
jgi:hypothetical protein